MAEILDEPKDKNCDILVVLAEHTALFGKIKIINLCYNLETPYFGLVLFTFASSYRNGL